MYKVIVWYEQVLDILLIILLYFQLVFVVSAKDSDIIEEAIYYFKANVFFKNYEIKVRENWIILLSE